MSLLKNVLNCNDNWIAKILSLFCNQDVDKLRDIVQYKINQSKKKFIVVIDDIEAYRQLIEVLRS